MKVATVRDGRPLSERVYELIRDEILDGTFEEGSPLVQEQLAERYGVSRTPIRDSLARLAHERLAVFIAGSGYAVNVIGINLISDVCEVRKGLEIMALKTFDAKFSPLDLARMEMLIAESEAVDQGDSDALFEASRAFHYALAAPCPNAYLVDTLKTVWENPIQRQIARSYRSDMTKVDYVADTHRKILAAARSGDSTEVIRLLDLCHQTQAHGQ